MNESPEALDLAGLMATEFHELKNQLGQLTLMLDEQGAEHPELAPRLNAPRLLCQRIVDRLVQVLTLYKQGHQQLSLNIEAIPPTEFAEQLAAQAHSLAGGRLRVTVQAEAAPPFWFMDRYLVETAMLNAVHNGLEYARAEISISVRSEDGGLSLCVHDDSDGYPAHILDNQGQAPGRSGIGSGTGLGLYFARAIAAAHENRGRRGRLSLSNDAGAVFCLWLP